MSSTSTRTNVRTVPRETAANSMDCRFLTAHPAHLGLVINRISKYLSKRYGIGEAIAASGICAVIEHLGKSPEDEVAWVCFPSDETVSYLLFAPSLMRGVHIRVLYDSEDNLFQFNIVDATIQAARLMSEVYTSQMAANAKATLIRMRDQNGFFNGLYPDETVWAMAEDLPENNILIITKDSVEVMPRRHDMYTTAHVCAELEASDGSKLAFWKQPNTMTVSGTEYFLVFTHYPEETGR